MKKIILSFFVTISLMYPNSSFAVIDLSSGSWTSSYYDASGTTCNDWTQSDGLNTANLNCDGISPWGGWTCSNGDGTTKMQEVVTAANHPGGPGGRGQRHWKGDGKNNNSGSMRISFTAPEPELWVRWYMRYEKGFSWTSLAGEKNLYFNPAGQHSFFVGWGQGLDKVNFRVYYDSNQNYPSADGKGWDSIMGKNPADVSAVSDGQWHYYEVHIKMDTNGADGIAEMWIDGDLKLSATTVDFSTVSAGWDSFLAIENSDKPSLSRCYYVDSDDWAISTTGYIGPLSPADTTSPDKANTLQAN